MQWSPDAPLRALWDRFVFPVPGWSPVSPRVDNWRTSAWEKLASAAPGKARVELELHEGDGP